MPFSRGFCIGTFYMVEKSRKNITCSDQLCSAKMSMNIETFVVENKFKIAYNA
jgi:hypothetical protein